MGEGAALLPRRHPSDIQDARLLAVLVKYVPPIIARSIVERARREAASGPEVSWTDPNGLLDRISVGVRLFAAPEHQSAILRGITDLAVADAEPSPSSHPTSDDAGPASTLKPSSHRSRDLLMPSLRSEDVATTRREPGLAFTPSSPPTSSPAAPAVLPPTSAGNASLPLPPPAGVPPSGGAPPPSGVGPFGASAASSTGPASAGVPPSGPGPLSRRDTDIMGVFATPTRRTPDSPPPSRGVFPTTPRLATTPAARDPAQTAPRPPIFRPSATTPVPPIGASVPTTPVPPAGTPAIPPPPPSTRASLTPVAGMPRHMSSSSDRSEAREITITLHTEHDIPRARQVAREICEALGTRALTQQRLVTIVSELGRNMVLYAGGGRITLRPPISSTRRVVVLAVDQGPGIANLSDIMNGRYKSRSGLGLGIVGTKRLADSFHIETGRNGTAISVEVIV